MCTKCHKLVDVGAFIHPILMHGLQRREVVEDADENIVEQGVLDVVVQLQTFIVECQSLFLVTQAT